MTRQELYELVWSHPLTELAPRFGLSDVGLRKLCKRHHIPVPWRGYWAKRASRKMKTPRPRKLRKLPHTSDVMIELRELSPTELAEKNRSKSAARRQQEIRTIQTAVSIPNQLPPVPHPIIQDALSARGDLDGTLFICQRPIYVSLTKPLLKRAFLFTEGLFRTLEARGHNILRDEIGAKMAVLGETFRIYFEESTTRVLAQTADRRLKELRSRGITDRSQMPSDAKRAYDEGARGFNIWGRRPTGRLIVMIYHSHRSQYRENWKWFDWKGQMVEDFVANAILAMEEHAVAAQELRRRQEEERRLAIQRQLRENRERRRREFLEECANLLERKHRLESLLNHLEELAHPDGNNVIDRIMRDLRAMVEEAVPRLEREGLESAIAKLGLFQYEDD